MMPKFEIGQEIQFEYKEPNPDPTRRLTTTKILRGQITGIQIETTEFGQYVFYWVTSLYIVGGKYHDKRYGAELDELFIREKDIKLNTVKVEVIT